MEKIAELIVNAYEQRQDKKTSKELEEYFDKESEFMGKLNEELKSEYFDLSLLLLDANHAENVLFVDYLFTLVAPELLA